MKFNGPLTKICVIAMTGFLMGNEGCQQETRVMRRRIQMGKIQAPTMVLPDERGSFDFQKATSAQAYELLRRTQAFSLIKIDPIKIYDSAGLSESDFGRCFNTVQGSALTENSCVMDFPQGVISGTIRGFQLSSSRATPLTLKDVALLPSLSYEFRHYEVGLKLTVSDPFLPDQILATNSQDHFGNDTGSAVRVSFSGYDHDTKAYYNSALRKVVDDGLTQAIGDLRIQWEKVSPWYATVVKNCDQLIYINGGSKTGLDLKVGDIVRVQAVTYRWSGSACNSALKGAVVSDEALAYAKVTTIGESMSVAKLIENDSRYPQNKTGPIRPGFRVYLEKMAP